MQQADRLGRPLHMAVRYDLDRKDSTGSQHEYNLEHEHTCIGQKSPRVTQVVPSATHQIFPVLQWLRTASLLRDALNVLSEAPGYKVKLGTRADTGGMKILDSASLSIFKQLNETLSLCGARYKLAPCSKTRNHVYTHYSAVNHPSSQSRWCGLLY